MLFTKIIAAILPLAFVSTIAASESEFQGHENGTFSCFPYKIERLDQCGNVLSAYESPIASYLEKTDRANLRRALRVIPSALIDELTLNLLLGNEESLQDLIKRVGPFPFSYLTVEGATCSDIEIIWDTLIVSRSGLTIEFFDLENKHLKSLLAKTTQSHRRNIKISLNYSSVGINSADLDLVARLPNVITLNLANSPEHEGKIIGLRQWQILSEMPMLQNLDLSNTKVDFAALNSLPPFLGMKRLTLRNSNNLTDDALRTLASVMPHLKELDIGGKSSLSSAGLAIIPLWRQLQTLSLANSPAATDDGLNNAIANRSALTWLNISATKVTNDGMEILERAPDLKYLNLSMSQTGSGVMRSLEPLEKLEELNLGFLDLKGEDLQEIGKKCTLRRLILECNKKLKKDDFRYLRSLSNLEFLNLYKTAIEDEELSAIQNLLSLRKLNIGATLVSKKGLECLKNLQNLRCLNLYLCYAINKDFFPLIEDWPYLSELDLLDTDISDEAKERLRNVYPNLCLNWSS